MSVKLPDQPWEEGMSFTVEETGLEYIFNGEVWLSEGTDISEFIENSGSVHLGNLPPDDPSEGDLWMHVGRDDAVLEDQLFVRVGDEWEPATNLQRERQHRIAADLLVSEQFNRADSHYMQRLDQIILPAPLLAEKQVTVHDGDLPDQITDDKIHFKRDLSTGDYFGEGAELAFRGDDPGAGIKYAIMHHHAGIVPYREEWSVRSVTFTNGTVRVLARETFGDSWASFDDWSCSLWLLTEEEAAAAGLDLTQQQTEETIKIENLESVGVLQYSQVQVSMGHDVAINAAKFPAQNVTVIGLNHEPKNVHRVMWDEEFPPGTNLFVQGADAMIVMAVEETARGGQNNRGHTLTGPILYESGTFVPGEDLDICHGEIRYPTALLLDGQKVGDSEWEDRITKLEEGSSGETGSEWIKTITIPGMTKSAFYEDNTFFPKNSSGQMADPYMCSKFFITTDNNDPYDLDSREGSPLPAAIGHLLVIREDNGRCVMSWRIGAWRAEIPGGVEITIGQPLSGDGSWGPQESTYSIVLKDV